MAKKEIVKKQTIKIGDLNVETLKTIDSKLKELQEELTAKIQSYNEAVTALNTQKKFLLQTVVSHAGKTDIPRWTLTEDYQLVEQTEDEYNELLKMQGAVETLINEK